MRRDIVLVKLLLSVGEVGVDVVVVCGKAVVKVVEGKIHVENLFRKMKFSMIVVRFKS